MATINISKDWNQYLSLFPTPRKDIYFSEEYVRLYETETEEALCFIYAEKDYVLLFPFLRRSFKFGGKTYYDFETVYGYSGPVANFDSPDLTRKALAAFREYCEAKNYVAGFVRFHPLLDNARACEAECEVIADRNTVAIDLSKDIDSIWMNEIHTKNRNSIKKGAKNNLIFIADYEYRYLEDFIKLYNSTMNKLKADEFYYFDERYYSNLKKNISDSFLGVVLHEDKVVSGAIFMYTNDYGHYHLSGSDKTSLSLLPNNFMIWEAAKELKKHNVKLFHLGGGINSDEHNPLFEFKKKFSKTLYQFYIGKMIFNHPVYDELCRAWESANPEKIVLFKHHLLKYKY